MEADAREQDRQIAGELADPGQLGRVRGADDEPGVTERLPAGGHHRGDPLVERRAVDVQLLQLGGARVARVAQGQHAAGGEERRRGVGPEVRVDGDGVGAVAAERLLGVVLGGRADVAALGVEHQHDVGVALPDVPTDPFEGRLGALRREVGELWLERAHEIGGGVDDRRAEALDGVGRPVERLRERRRIRIESDAQHRARQRPGLGEALVESHRWPMLLRVAHSSRLIAPVGQRSAASLTLSCSSGGGSSCRM